MPINYGANDVATSGNINVSGIIKTDSGFVGLGSLSSPWEASNLKPLGYDVGISNLIVENAIGFGESYDTPGLAFQVNRNGGIVTVLANNGGGNNTTPIFEAVGDSHVGVQSLRINGFGAMYDPLGAQSRFELSPKRTTTNSSPTNSAIELGVIPPKTTITFTVAVSAYNVTDNASAGWILKGVIRRNNNNDTIIVGTVTKETWKEAAMNSTDANVTADNTNELLSISFTGLASKTIDWVAEVHMTRVTN